MRIGIYILLSLYLLIFRICPVDAQVPTQVLKGQISDKETRLPLIGATVVIVNSDPLTGTTTDAVGKFRITTQTGRITLRVSYLGYEELILTDILVATGKEVDLIVEMREKVISAREVIIIAGRENQAGINQMASISTQTIRAADALRYAGGFYDPSRIVNSFAGVTTANSDESNDIVIRGNSSRGLLWKLEGIEIPNPNHFGDGQGGSGGAYSAITSNVISNFDFFTGAFPAEYGNAVSGVMDLNLRKGNQDNYEYAFQTGMIGAEISAEGPLDRSSGSSFLIDARYVNFSILSNLNLIDLGESNYAPRSKDVVINLNFPGRKSGNINIFGFYGDSEFGKVAIHDTSSWKSDSDRWEEMQGQGSAVAGIKHLLPLPGGRSFIRSVVAYTGFFEKYSEGYVDSAFVRTNSYHHNYSYPALRFSLLLNSKVSPKYIIRTGVNLQYLFATMEDYRKTSSGSYDTLVSPTGYGTQYQLYTQLKSRITDNLEINTGIHVISLSTNLEMSIEPRIGLRWQFFPGRYFNIGAGLHSRTESFPVYYSMIKNDYGIPEPLNKDLGFTKSFQVVAGFDLVITRDIHLRVEAYNQNLFDVPIIDNRSSKYSAINSSEELPVSDLVNKGLGFNRGIEITFERLFSKNYYYLLTLSLFNSEYKPGDGKWYNTYYNTGYVSNILAGRDFIFGKDKRNSVGINAKTLFRGGYRYTPVNIPKSIKAKRIIYDTSLTYAAQQPDFIRIDAGINFRRNNPGFSWMIMLDVQNLTNRKNVFRKRFSFENGAVVTRNVYSLGAVPVLNLRIEF
jgi:hypothetical protein